MISSRSPVRAQALAVFSSFLLTVSYVQAAGANQGELAARAPTPSYGRRPWQYSSFAADNDSACCAEGTEKATGSCCGEGLVCDVSNSTGYGPTCISVPTSTNGTNHTGNHTTDPVPTETDSGAASVAAWGLWTSVVGLAAVVGAMSF